MSEPCAEKENIHKLMSLVGALAALPKAIDDMRLDLREMMKEMQVSVADSREYRTLIAQNRRDIENLNKVDHEQWTAIEELASRLNQAAQRAGERAEALEKWQAALNGGSENGLAHKLDTLIGELERRKGRAALLVAIPVITSFGALLIALLTYLNTTTP